MTGLPFSNAISWAPVELVSLARRKAQRRLGLLPSPHRAPPLHAGVAPNRVIAALHRPSRRSSSKTRTSVSRARRPLFVPSFASNSPSSRLRHGPSSAAADGPAQSEIPSLPSESPLRTTLRLSRNSRQITLIAFFHNKIGAPYLRNRLYDQNPHLTLSPMRATVNPLFQGSLLGCRSPPKRGPYSTPINRQRRPSPRPSAAHDRATGCKCDLPLPSPHSRFPAQFSSWLNLIEGFPSKLTGR